MEVVEYDTKKPTCRWSLSKESRKVTEHVFHENSRKISEKLLSAFLPEGYPDSVPPDYLGFQFWDTVQALCSYIRGVLCSQALLTGVGVGTEAATPLSATFQFVMKDLSGMLGSILFTYCQGSALDSYDKQWRLFADGLNNVGLALELASPHFPSLFLFMASLGSVARAITGVAGSASRAALTQHFARHNRNAADVAAKECSQETATVLLGMLLGMFITHTTTGNHIVAWATFLVLTVLHMLSNIWAVRCLKMRSLNRPRTKLLVDVFRTQARVPTPAEVGAMEPLTPPPLARFLSLLTVKHKVDIVLGARVSQLLQNAPEKAKVLEQLPDSCRYVVAVNGRSVLVLLHVDADDNDILSAYAQACTTADMLEDQPQTSGAKAEQMAQEWHTRSWDKLLQDAKAAGWTPEYINLAPGRWRASWAPRQKSN